MKKSFLKAKSPLITEMVQVKTAQLAEQKIKNNNICVAYWCDAKKTVSKRSFLYVS